MARALLIACFTSQAVFAQEPADRTLGTVVVEGQRQHSTVVLDEPAKTGSRLDIDARDLPASVSVISQALIALRGARTAVEAVESAVGMTGGTSVGSIPNYATRGFAGNDITIMRDGIRQNTASQSSRPLDSFLFDRIEVLKGPASLLYGEGAVGGAVNYVSKLPSEAFQAEALAAAGMWDAVRLGLGLGGPTALQGLSYRLDISHNESDGYVDDSGSDYHAAAAALRYRLSDATDLTLQGTFLKDSVSSYYGTPLVYDAVINAAGVQEVRRANTSTDRLVNARIDARTRRLNYNTLDNFAKADNSFTRLLVDSRLAPHLTVRNESYVATQHFDWRNNESQVWNPATESVERSSFFLIYRNDLQWGNRLDCSVDGELAGRPNKFLVGGLYDHNDQIRNSGQQYPRIPDPASVPLTGFERGAGMAGGTERTARILTETTALYVENVYEMLDSLKLVAGLRYDRIDVQRRSYLGEPTFNKSYDPFTGRIGLVFAATPATNFYASFSKAAQPVSQLVSLSASHADFSLQKGKQYEIGMKSSLGTRADVTLAVFDIEKTDLLTSTLIDGVRYNSQIGAQVSQGVELATAWSLPARIRLDANFAWTWQAEYQDFNENLGDGVISRAGNTPTNVAKKVASLFVIKTFDQWELTAGARHVGARQANNNNGIQLAAYTTVDAGVRLHLGKAMVTLQGRNLTDVQYAEWAAGGGLMVRLADPRSAELSVSYSF